MIAGAYALVQEIAKESIAISLAAPAIALLLIAVVKEKFSRAVGVASTGIVLAVSLFLLAYLYAGHSIAISTSIPFISSLNINFEMGINPISFALFMMSSIVLFATSFAGNVHRTRQKATQFLIVLFQLASAGLFLSLNLFIFFIFWDIGVIAMFFFINSLGSESRKSAAMKFLIYEILASSMLLFGILMIYFYTPVHSFSISKIIANSGLIPIGEQAVIFASLFIAFIINMPVFPFHLWLPDAHTEAPTQGSMLLSGILTKFGGFGVILLFEMLPISRMFGNYIAALAVVSAFYSVLVLMRQDDIKRIIAYSTITEMAIVLFGISEFSNFGLYGSVYAMLSHGLLIAMLFLGAGSIEVIFNTRNIHILKGIVKNAGLVAYSMLAGIFIMLGIPLSSAFIADLLIFIGAVSAFGLAGLAPLLALLLVGAFLYLVISRSFMSTGKYTRAVGSIGADQRLAFCVLLFFIFLFGAFPFIMLGVFKI
ncbi:MAG: NADH-quinone oxidoreductase subunit M [Candidatus Marsarchaeota archaeon]|nr:NADH-quinone oxidoreductase subunit M [Candidatus Marsarchaeota archaeon]MCL5106228.1 NADH-quinone oxidoreductase subunit M [Candidatus Marsarchaeota archaeon]